MTALAGPALAESAADMFDRCTGKATGSAVAAECRDVRASFANQIQECLNVAEVAVAGRTSSHAFKARYLACAQTVRAELRPQGG